MPSEAEIIEPSIHVDPDSIRRIECEIGAETVELVNDAYSDRIRCDHPGLETAGRFAELLKDKAFEYRRERVVALVEPETAEALAAEGFVSEGVMPGFYRGQTDCEVMGWAQDDSRLELAAPRRAEKTDRILEAKRDVPSLHVAVETALATTEDSEALADLLGATFPEYPTPSSDPAYVAKQIDSGAPFRVIRESGEVVACASADLVVEAKTAELTDCATRPGSRGRGYMQSILRDLMGDLREREYPTAFTLARAAIPGVNIAFQRLGFEYRGRMPQSCRIGDGLEDMNIWSRWL